ncbi:MAG: 30S ribosomal protein S20 [Tyzzerella sp.]|uniref:Small ribosomal subunit protein bS20 n=1 Tax=Candidatus Fimicola merdigallinarum TaxID=2840819 RepID=A0A9D9DVG6_9FIRM|nr:30S ribosomal protein S20 [Candidatus Fimicola merdigallinarum]
MANIKSAKKRIKVISKKTLRNKMIKSQTKTAIKKVMVAVNAGNKEEAQVALVGAISAIDRAYTKGIFHKNAAARRKSTLARLVNGMNA